MKELEKTKRISIGAVLIILLLIIAFLIYERPKHVYKVNTETTLSKVVSKDYFVNLDELNKPEIVLIDVRNKHDFEKGHLENAINIQTSNLLNENISELFKEINNTSKVAVLYGSTPTEANAPFMILYQLGYDNIKILLAENSYTNNKLITKKSSIENNVADISAFIIESQKKAAIKPKKIAPKKATPKKVVPKKKKKKLPVEGGC